MQGPDCVSGDGQHHSCCLHKQGGRYEIRVSLCPPLVTALLVQPQANSAGRLNVIADKLIQTEWSLLQDVFHHLCVRVHTPQMDLFATRFNHKLPLFMFPVLDQSASRVDALNLPLEELDAYVFPPVSLFGQVVSK